MKFLFAIFALGGALSACDGSPGSDSSVTVGDQGDSANILSVSNYPFTFNDKPGVNINFSTDEYEECTVTFAKSSVKVGFQTQTDKSEGGMMDLSCLTGGGLYMLDDSELTHAQMRIDAIDDKKATLIVAGKLYAIRDKKRLELEDTTLIISGSNLGLLKK